MNARIVPALLCAVALIVSACGGDGESAMFDAAGADTEVSDANEGATDTSAGPDGETGSGGATASALGTFRLNDSELSDAEVGEAVGVYQDFLDAKNRFRIEGVSESGELTALAASGVVGDVVAWRDEQYEVEETLDFTFTGRRSVANVMNVVGSATELLMHDCVEVEETTEVFGTPTTSATLVDQIVTMSSTGTGWTVQEIDVRHTGTFGSQGLGCVPDYHVPRLNEALTEFHAEMDAMAAAPQDGVPDVVAGFIPDDELPALERDTKAQADAGVILTDPTRYSYEVLGSAAEYGNRSFVVAVCTTYPEGLSSRDADTGEVVEEGISPGAQTYYEAVITSLPNDDGGFDNRIVDAVNPRNEC